MHDKPKAAIRRTEQLPTELQENAVQTSVDEWRREDPAAAAE
ncbi:MAG: hypothetical protein M2R45_01539 [Verrucomicrobia subdivision 3 bacterium]|nr:hypothetical protein [Limisphaerales bacterium]MCS1413333.1 hypothetical protein [Limisphaerales bacterium]